MAHEEADVKPKSRDKMGFSKHDERTYRAVMTDYYDYVCWARSQEDPYSGLARFFEWTNSDEGMMMEAEDHCNHKFPFGQHNG
jgi:hypothetical protein